jgi:hypothetical protein
MAARARMESAQTSQEGVREVVAHPGGGAAVEAAHAGDFVAEALFGEDFGDAVLGHPGLVAVPEPLHSQAWLDREPAGQWPAVRDGLDAAAAGWFVAGGQVCGAGAVGRLGGWRGRDLDAGPDGGVDDISDPDLSYAPPLGSPWEAIQIRAPSLAPRRQATSNPASLSVGTAWVAHTVCHCGPDHPGRVRTCRADCCVVGSRHAAHQDAASLARRGR